MAREQKIGTAPPNDSALRVVVLYEALDGGLLAKEVFDRISTRLSANPGGTLTVWRLDSLTDERLIPLIYQDVVQTDMLMVVADGRHPLSQSMENTLSEWFAGPEHPNLGIVLILQHTTIGSGQTSPVRQFFQGLTANGDTDFFCRSGSRRTNRKVSPTPLFGDDLSTGRNTTSHWGINE